MLITKFDCNLILSKVPTNSVLVLLRPQALSYIACDRNTRYEVAVSLEETPKCEFLRCGAKVVFNYKITFKYK
jgi:hypothetical protein